VCADLAKYTQHTEMILRNLPGKRSKRHVSAAVFARYRDGAEAAFGTEIELSPREQALSIPARGARCELIGEAASCVQRLCVAGNTLQALWIGKVGQAQFSACDGRVDMNVSD